MRKIALVLMLTACGSEDTASTRTVQVEPEYGNISPEIRPHLREFIEYCKQSEYARSCSVNLKKLRYAKVKENISDDRAVIGTCGSNGDERVVELKANFADKDSLQFKTLVWHELGHCLMDLDHNDNSFNIMNSNISSELRIALTWPRLVKSVFTKRLNVHIHQKESVECGAD